jgi:alpha-L-fucosidase 2
VVSVLWRRDALVAFPGDIRDEGVASEHLQLNEATLWSGGPRDWNNPGAKEILPQVRAAIFAGDARVLRRRAQGA